MLRPTPRQCRTPRRTPLSRLAATLVLVLTTVTALLVVSAPSASADNDVQSVSPSGGAALTSSPGAVRIVFERPLLSLVSVSVRGPAGDVTQGRAQVRGDTVVQPLETRLANGRYSVSWQVLGLLDDTSGSSSFRIARKVSRATSKPSPTPTASPTPSRTPRPSPTPKASRTTAVAVPIDTNTPPSSASNVAAPQVDGIGYTGSDHLPPPIVWWGMLLVLASIGYVTKKHLDARRAAATRGRRRQPSR